MVLGKMAQKPGHAFKQFIDKNYMASTIHVEFYFQRWCWAFSLFFSLLWNVMFDRQWTGIELNKKKEKHRNQQTQIAAIVASMAAPSHIVLISLYSTHRRQTTISRSRRSLVYDRILFIHSVFIFSRLNFFFFSLLLSIHNLESEREREKRFVIYHKIAGIEKSPKWNEPMWKKIN